MLLHLKSVLDLMLYLYFFLLIVAYPMELLEELATIGTWEDDTGEGVLLGTFEEPETTGGGVSLT
jgi:hypothetical protein